MRRLLAIFILLTLGCEDSSEDVFSCDDISIKFQGIDYTSCGGSNGSLIVIASGGEAPYTYRNGANGTPQTDNVFTDLESAYYTMYVEDQNGCQDSARTFLGSLEAVKAVALTQPSGCGKSDGVIRVIGRNGDKPYRYQLGENANYTDEDTFRGLPSGVHSVWVKDANECFLGIYPVVLSGVDVDPILEMVQLQCSSENCHGGSVSPSLLTEEEVNNNADEILSKTKEEPIHYDHTLTNSQIDSIECWVSDLKLLKL